MSAVLVRPIANASSPALAADCAQSESLFRQYSAHGGILTGDDLAAELRSQRDQPVSLVARWLVDRRVLGFRRRGETYLPRFQFAAPSDAGRMGDPLPGVQKAIVELSAAFDDIRMAEWFLCPNPWLQHRVPATVVAESETYVAQAARADRFIATGW